MNPHPIVFGLTGSIGSGKSTVSSILSEFNFLVIDADELSREVTKKDSESLKEISDFFGKDIIDKDGNLNRSLLGKIIFSDSSKKETLESILHPRIRKLWLSKLEELKLQKTKAIFYSAPLIFESSHTYTEIKSIILVSAPYETCLQRVMLRNNLSLEEAKKRLDSQLSDNIKKTKSDFIIDNSKDLNMLRQSTISLINLLTDRFNIR